MTRPWVLVVALAAAACSNAAHEQQVQLRGICQGFVTGTTTIAQAGQAYEGAPVLPIACRTDYTTIGSDDQCPHDGQTSVCDLVYEFITNDCSGPFSGSTCANWCEVRVLSPVSQSATICARQWLASQVILDRSALPPAP